MWVRYFEDTDTLLVTFKKEPVYESEYIEDLGIVVDYNQNDEVIGLEIFGWSEIEKKGAEWVIEELCKNILPKGCGINVQFPKSLKHFQKT